MYCKKCGAELPNDSTFCINCGGKLDNVANPTSINVQNKTKKNKKTIFSIVLVVAIICGIFVAYNEIGKANLKKNLKKEWSRIESYITLVLDFDDDEIDYNFESGIAWLDSTIATYDYKVISSNKIKVKHKGYNYETTVTIEFNDDKTMMTMTPAITSTDSSENWFLY